MLFCPTVVLMTSSNSFFSVSDNHKCWLKFINKTAMLFSIARSTILNSSIVFIASQGKQGKRMIKPSYYKGMNSQYDSVVAFLVLLSCFFGVSVCFAFWLHPRTATTNNKEISLFINIFSTNTLLK